jgi:hypothetical protein
LTRILVGLLAAAFWVVPLIILNLQTDQTDRLITVSVFIVVLPFVVSLVTKVSNSETMAATAAYAAVLAVLVSSSG